MNESEIKQAIKANLQLLSKEQLIDKLADIIVAFSFRFCTDYTQHKITNILECGSNIQEIKNMLKNEKGT